jgi:hypothetical protein
MCCHHAKLEAGPVLTGPVADPLESAPARLRRVCLDEGGVEAREVAARRVELGGEVHRDFTVHLAQDVRRTQLVLGVAVGEQQADHDSLHTGVVQVSRGLAHVLFAQRQHLLAQHVDAPAHALHQLARHDRRVVEMGGDVEAVGVGVAQVGLDAALEPQVVLLSRGDEGADASALPLEQPVQHGRPAVDPGNDPGECLGRIRLPLPQGVLRGLHESGGLVVGSRLRLAHHEGAAIVDDEGVGHRAARVDGQYPRLPAVLRHPGHENYPEP